MTLCFVQMLFQLELSEHSVFVGLRKGDRVGREG